MLYSPKDQQVSFSLREDQEHSSLTNPNNQPSYAIGQKPCHASYVPNVSKDDPKGKQAVGLRDPLLENMIVSKLILRSHYKKMVLEGPSSKPKDAP